MQKRVVVGLSGGVDSSVAASLLLEQGYEVEAVYLECYNEPGCRTDQDKAHALKVAMQLGISFQVLDFRKEYKAKVIEYFYAEYEAGRTPNPDVMCNREIKFGIFYDWAIKHGYDYVATGHYARIKDCQLQRAKDESKDQSYFLWQIPQDHLAHMLFPLGGMLKSEVRAKAHKLKLATASKPDSMGICFIGDVDVAQLLRDRLGEQPGEVVMKITNNQASIHKQSGNGHKKNIINSKQFDDWSLDVGYLEDDYVVVGRHKGLWFYTIGSRGGWEVLPQMQSSDMPPLYVIEKDSKGNRLIVGKRDEAMTREIRVLELGIRKQEIGEKLWVRIRNLGELHAVTQLHSDTITLEKPIFAPAPGQSAVFYDGKGILAGGGIIV